MKSYLEEIFGLQGKVALVTGGAMGIGHGIAFCLAKAGATVIIADIVSQEDAKSTMDELIKISPDSSYYQIDLRDIKKLPLLIEYVSKKHGDLNLLVNNAGIFKYMSMLEMTEEMWDKVIDLNLKSVAFLSRESAKFMKEKGHGGRIINISSIDAIKPVAANLPHYDSSKAALRMFTRSFAKEVAPLGILVNDIAPGGVNTPGAKKIAGDNLSEAQIKAMEAQTEGFTKMIPLQRMGEPEDIGQAVLFLAGKASSYMTGTTIIVDGGLLIM